jgi:hypothetical protein
MCFVVTVEIATDCEVAKVAELRHLGNVLMWWRLVTYDVNSGVIYAVVDA